MKQKSQKVSDACLKLIPVCAASMMKVCSNSTTTWIRGQEEMPANAKRYRKF